MDGPQTDPWAAFNPQAPAPQNPADALGRPVITSVSKPEVVPGSNGQMFQNGQAVDIPGFKAAPKEGAQKWRMLTPQDSAFLPDRPGFMSDTGDVKYGPAGTKGGAPVDKATAQAHISDILHSIDDATAKLGNPLASGLPGAILGHIPGTDAYSLRSLIGEPSDPNNPGQITGDLRQQGIAYLRALNGGNGVGTVARSQQEQAALQSAMSNIRQGLAPDELKGALGNVKQIYLRAYAQSFGLDPNDPAVQKQFGIDANYKLPGGVPGVNSTATADETITAPKVVPIDMSGPSDTEVSNGEMKAVTNEKLAAIAPQLEQYLNSDPSKVSNAMILGFMKKNGVDPNTTNIVEQFKLRGKAKFHVNPQYNVPLSGSEKVGAELSGSPAGALALGAADAGTAGLLPDVVGSLPGQTRTGVIQARDALAGAHPGATVLGNFLGGLTPLPGGAEASALVRAGKTAGQGALYGFAGSDNPDIRARLFNAAKGAVVGGVTHGVSDAGMRAVAASARPVGRAVDSVINGPETAAENAALGKAARGMPIQDLKGVAAADTASTAAGVPAPAAASLDRAGQDYLARTAQGSPQARAVADSAVKELRNSLPKQLAGDFDAAIQDMSPHDTTAFLNRPVREIAGDIQDMAGREFETGIAPIKNEKLAVTPELASDLDHDRISGAIKDALANHNLDETTRTELRALLPNLKALSAAPDIARAAYAKGIPLTVDGARNIATALDRAANRLAEGSEGGMELSRLSRDIRGEIATQFPEYAPVNARYASRMRAKQAMFSARDNFFAATPDNIDTLSKASGNYTDTPNEPEYGATLPPSTRSGFTITPSAKPLPSNRQLAGTGAREAASVKAGENGAATPDRIANNVNQQGNNATVLGDKAAAQLQARAGARANAAQAVERVASGGTQDRTESWFKLVKQAAAAKVTGGSHFAVAHAAAAVPGLSGQDAARVVRLYLDSSNSQRVFKSLQSAYGARRARFIMAKMASVASSATAVRGFPQKKEP